MNPDLDPSDRVRDAESILEQLALTALDDDYYVDHDKHAGRLTRSLTPLVLAFFGLLVTVAAVQTRTDRPATEVERSALIEDIGVRQELVNSKRDSVALLKEEIAELEAVSSIRLPETSAMMVSTGATAVQGPGIMITVQSADDDIEGGRLTDTDIQLLVNGLWLAGAEAVSINGHRLAATSAIRSAGEAITVNYRSISEPIRVSAIGDRDDLREKWTHGPSGRYFALRAEESNIDSHVQGFDERVLPAAPQSRLKVSAKPIRRNDS